MVFSTHFLILFLVALACSAVGFYKYVYFISIGYGASIAGQGIAMLILFRGSLDSPKVLLCVLLIIYGFRLSGYLLIRELKSTTYRKHMTTEIKDGSSMNFILKILLWISCAALYAVMISPVFYRIENNNAGVDAAYIIGIIFIITGVILEASADASKNMQKKANPKRFCDKGLFRFVRCPNYLGEMTIWTGVFISGMTSFSSAGQWIVAATGYLGITYVMFSGARRLEIRQNKNYGSDPEYQEYVKTVPIMVPFVPLYSVEKFKFLIL